MMSQEEMNAMKSVQQEILEQLKALNTKNANTLTVKNITAKEFMAAVRIGRTKFDQLVHHNKIRIIKKRRKIYVPVAEVDRYFADPGILWLSFIARMATNIKEAVFICLIF